VTRLTGFGRTAPRECRLVEPADVAEIARILSTESGPVIARGAGGAYGDAALQTNLTLSTRRLDRLLAFDPTTGIVRAEAGLTLAALLQHATPDGWSVPVLPGTQAVTLGGMAAADVHGKNHPAAGSFGAHVRGLQIVDAQGQVRECAPDSELFGASLGGMGLTGIITQVTLQLERAPWTWWREERLHVETLHDLLAAFDTPAPMQAAWMDGHRAILHRAAPLDRPAPPPGPRWRPSVPVDAPGFLLSRPAIALFNTLRRGTLARSRETTLDRIAFPLDGIANWNRLYGRAGFHQYQCLLPPEPAESALAAVWRAIARAGVKPALAVLKRLGASRSPAWIGFACPGFTLALDFPASARTLRLMDELDAIVADHMGRLYLAKDSRTSPAMLRRLQPEVEHFANWRRATGADRFQSALSQRLAL